MPNSKKFIDMHGDSHTMFTAVGWIKCGPLDLMPDQALELADALREMASTLIREGEIKEALKGGTQ